MKRFNSHLFALVLAMLVSGCGDFWEIAVVDSNGNVGEYCSIAVDGNGYAHIAYFDHIEDEQIGGGTAPYGNLKYATNAGGVWETVTLDTGTGVTPRIFVDDKDKVHIVHTKVGISDPLSISDLKYTTNISGSWETITINSQVVKGSDASIAVDSNGKIHISLYNNEGAGTTPEGAYGGLRYVTNATGEWTWIDVDTSSTAGNDTDIAVDGNDMIHICYLDKNDGMMYASNVGASWDVYNIDNASNVGWNASISVDSNNSVHISYSDPSPTLDPFGNGYLKYATNKSGAWSIEIVDDQDAGFYTGLAVDSGGGIHITYYAYEEGVPGRLKYVTDASGTWLKETVDDAEFVGLYCAIAIDPNGTPHVSYYDYINQSLKYAKRR